MAGLALSALCSASPSVSTALEGRTSVVPHGASLDAKLRLWESRASEVLELGISKAHWIVGILHTEPALIRIMLAQEHFQIAERKINFYLEFYRWPGITEE